MKVFPDAWNRGDLPSGTVATVGNFDGLHRGQQAIVADVVERASRSDLTATVVTFEPHPLQVLRPDSAPLRLTTAEQKIGLLRDCGVQALAVVRFDREFSTTPATEFVRKLLFDRLDARQLLVGSRFAFGRDREGNVPLLAKLAARDGRDVIGIAELEDGGEPVSSTRVRAAILRGAVDEAERLLGRPYRVSGRVIHGDAMGRKLGWPTINLELDNELLPAFGVYRSRVEVERRSDGGRRGCELLCAVTNVGLRPTLHSDREPTLESHILDFEGDLYGSSVVIEMLDRLRGERRFSSVDELRRQIARDVAEARRRFSATAST